MTLSAPVPTLQSRVAASDPSSRPGAGHPPGGGGVIRGESAGHRGRPVGAVIHASHGRWAGAEAVGGVLRRAASPGGRRGGGSTVLVAVKCRPGLASVI